MGLTVQEQQNKVNSLERQFFEFLADGDDSADNSGLSSICSSVIFSTKITFQELHQQSYRQHM